MPTKSSEGKVRKVPPPATVFNPPAMRAAAKRTMAWEGDRTTVSSF
jgi:hypothetical protein